MIINEELLRTKGALERNYMKGDVIFREAEKPDYYFQIIEGNVKLGRRTENNGILFELLSRGSEIGMFCIFADMPYVFDAIATTDCSMLAMGKNDFLAMAREDANIISSIMKHLSKAVSRRYKMDLIHLKKCFPDKVLELFSLLKYEKTDQEILSCPINLTIEQIAFMTGLDKEAVQNTLQTLESDGIIMIADGKIFY